MQPSSSQPLTRQITDCLLTVPPIKPQAEKLFRQLTAQLGSDSQPLTRFIDDTAVTQLTQQFITATETGDFGISRFTNRCRQHGHPVPACLPEARFLTLPPAPLLPDVPPIDNDPQLRQTAVMLMNAHRLAQLQQQLFSHKPELPLPIFNIQQPETILNQIDHFLERVNRELYPVDLEVSDHPYDGLCWQLEYVPLTPLGVCYEREIYGIWGQEGYGEPEPLDMLMHLAVEELYGDYGYLDDAQHTFENTYPDLPTLPTGCTLRSLLPSLSDMALPEPLCHIADAIRIILKDTDTFWLDVSYQEFVEGWQPVSWEDEATIDALCEQWHTAKTLQTNAETLINWCRNGRFPLKEKLHDLMTILHHAHHHQHGQLPLPGLAFNHLLTT